MILIVIAMVMAAGTFAMTLAAARGSLAPNGLVGIRTPATQRSDAAWRAGHRAALPIVGWGGLVAVVAGAVALTALPDSAEPDAAGMVLLAFDVAMLLVAAVVAQRAAKSTHSRSDV